MSEGASFAAARIEDLSVLMAYVDEVCGRGRVPAEVAFAVRLAVEEAFTNIVRHGYGSTPGPVRCDVRVESGDVTVTLVDEAPVFDPADAPAPELNAALDDRVEGGLGWHLIRELMDELRHEPGAERGNVFTMIKRLPTAAS